jgi:Flp pilus assembly protein TadG
MRNLLRSERGTSLIEFALVLPMLLLLLIGVIEVGRYATFAIIAANAARAGVEYGAQNLRTAKDTTGMQSAALADAQNLSSWATPTAKVLCSVNGGSLAPCAAPLPANSVYYVEVQVTGTFSSILNYPLIPKRLPVSGSAVMRVAYQ